MKLFKVAKKNLSMCLYYPNQAQIFDVKRLYAVMVQILVVISILLFAIFETNDITDYVISAYLIAAAFGISIAFIDTTLKTTKIFALIDLDVKVIKASKLWQP